MGMGYNVTTVLANFDAFRPVLLISYALTLAAFVVYYIAAIIKGFREKHCGMPWQCNMWNMSNDFLFVFPGFKYWWTPGLETNHWFTHIIWAGMVAWFIAELITHYQAMKWDMKEIFPNVQNKHTAWALYVGVQLVFIAYYHWLWSAIDDPLAQVMIATTVVNCTLFVPFLFKERKGTKGISAWALWSVLVAQIAWWFFAVPAMDPVMGNFWTYLFGVAATAVSIGCLVVFYRRKKEEAEAVVLAETTE